MARPPSIQWYYKQWLGDSKVMAMDWDATAMHFHLLMISIQEEPPGSIPNDVGQIRRWLRLPSGQSDSDRVWARVQPQIFAAWMLTDDRWFNPGMVQTFERKAHYINRSAGNVPLGYETGTKNRGDPLPSENKEVKKERQSQNQPIEDEVFLVEQCDRAPEGFPVAALAMGWLGKIGMPNSVANIRACAGAIELVIKRKGFTPARATDWLLMQARESQSEGVKVNRFWLEDGEQVWEGRVATAADRERIRDRERAQVGIYRPS